MAESARVERACDCSQPSLSGRVHYRSASSPRFRSDDGIRTRAGVCVGGLGATHLLLSPASAISLSATPQRNWWTRTELNRQPPACKAGALPIELRGPSGGCGWDRTSVTRLKRTVLYRLSYASKNDGATRGNLSTPISPAEGKSTGPRRAQREKPFATLAIVGGLARQPRNTPAGTSHAVRRTHVWTTGWDGADRTPDLSLPRRAPSRSATSQSGGPDRHRTCDQLLTRQPLYRTELQGQHWRRGRGSNSQGCSGSVVFKTTAVAICRLASPHGSSARRVEGGNLRGPSAATLRAHVYRDAVVDGAVAGDELRLVARNMNGLILARRRV